MSQRRLWWIQRLVGVLLSVSIAVPLHAPMPAQAVCTPGGMTEWPISLTPMSTGIQSSPSAVYLQGYLWMYNSIPSAASIMRVNPSDGTMLEYSTWPAGVSHHDGNTLLSDGTYLWLAPAVIDDNNAFVRIDPSDGSMTAYQNWPVAIKDATKAYSGAIFDGTFIWLYPLSADYLVRFNVSTGSIKPFDRWPESFANGTNVRKFYTAAVDGSNLYLIPRKVVSPLQPPMQHIIKVDTTNGRMTTIPWPATFLASGGVYEFEDALFVNGYLWLFMFSWTPGVSHAILRVDPQTGAVVEYNSWPTGFTDGFLQPWREAVYDGTDIWLVPAGANMIIQFDPNTGAMTGYNNWPVGLSPMSVTFGGGVYDGTSVWLYPSHTATYGNFLQLASCSTSPAPQPPVPPPVPTPPPTPSTPSTPKAPTVPEVVVTPPPPPPPAIFAASYPYQDSGAMNMEVNANYATWADMGIVPPTLLTDTVSISLTLEFLANTPQWSLTNAQPVSVLGKRAIRDANNTAKPKYRPLREVVYPETGYALSGYLLDYWERQGGVARLGYPMSDPVVVTDAATGSQSIMQYTERGRLEQPILKDGSLGMPQLGRIGAEYLGQQQPYPAAVLPVAPPTDPSVQYFVETRHTLQGVFAEYFAANGGLAQNGYPLTEIFTEQYAEYPYPVTVQYFERVRLEYHGDPADPLYGQSNAVYGGMTLGRLGAAVQAGQ